MTGSRSSAAKRLFLMSGRPTTIKNVPSDRRTLAVSIPTSFAGVPSSSETSRRNSNSCYHCNEHFPFWIEACWSFASIRLAGSDNQIDMLNPGREDRCLRLLSVIAAPDTHRTQPRLIDELPGVWSVRKSPLGHIDKSLSSTFACTLLASCTKQQVSGVGVHHPLGHAH